MNSSTTMSMQPIEPLDLSTITMPTSVLSGSIYTLNTMASSTVVTTPNSGTYISGSGNGGFVYATNTTAPSWCDTIQLGNDSLTGAGVLNVKGDAEFEGDVFIKGKSLTDTLSKIEERLAILHPNEKLEQKWDELKELGRLYRELEKDILEKEKIVEILKR